MDVLPVSVVIPAYRRPEMVERAVRSALQQSRPPAEIIVVDDASGDETGPRAAELGARVITHERNAGEGAARNTGMAAAQHDWIALLDSDDEWLPSHLETLWTHRGDHVVVGTAALVAAERRVYGWAGRRTRILRGAADVAIPENKLVPSAVMLRRQPALAIGGFRQGMPRAADLELWTRLLTGASGIAIPRVTVLYHVHPGQVTTDRERMWAAHKAVLDGVQPAALRDQVLLRHEGVVAWDSARAALADGTGTGTALRSLSRLRSPQRMLAVGQLLASRYRSRRLAGRHGPEGEPSVAVMPGVSARATPGSVDLRNRGRARALARLLLTPTARALVNGRADAVAVRALGVEPVRVYSRRAP